MKNSFIISEIEKENSTTKNSKTEKLNIVDIEFKEEVANNISIDSEKEKSFSQINLKDTKSIKSKLNDKIGVIDSSISFDTNLLPTASLTDFESNIKTLGKVDMEYNKNKSNRFTFGILSAYEYSFVEEVADRCRGYKLGIELAYQFNNNFQISSGISFSKKRYNTAGTNYKPIDAMGIQWKGAPPEVVTGNCNMYEIPIEFTYYLKGYSKNGFFIGTGINSYFITNETYNFDFAPEFQALNKLSWSTEKNPQLGNNNHLFGVVTAQFGYQHYVSKNIAFQVAPYLQIPTTGIGFGDVKLMSTGIQFKMSFAK